MFEIIKSDEGATEHGKIMGATIHKEINQHQAQNL